jgi:hypothetical protein
MFQRYFIGYLISLLLIVGMLSCASQERSVKEVMDQVVTRLYKTMDEKQLSGLTDEKIMQLLSVDEKKILATRFWMFDVNVPVTVSLMRHIDQKDIPFWIEPSGFKKTAMVVKNAEYTYEVWQKNFGKGRVELGINGFDKHRSHYFIAVAPQKETDNLQLSNFYPVNQHIEIMQRGAFTYHDWDELVLTDVPDALLGQQLLTTIRGRAREAHLIGAFRKTPFPSSADPDQIVLTWSENPQTSQSIQWRTDPTENRGAVKLWKMGEDEDTQARIVSAETKPVEDRMLQNDRFINRYTVKLKNLDPDTEYLYRVGKPAEDKWTKIHHFKTAPPKDKPFTFVYFGDTHRSPHWGKLINTAFERHPQTAFYTIGGDIVSTGLDRNDWDQLFEYSKDVISERALMPTLGNHDSQDGLGVWMYLDLFDLPKDGPPEIEPERTYSFIYGNARFLMVDATVPNDINTRWLERQLAEAEETWKFAIFHFPPYVAIDDHDIDYKEIRENWGAIFDKYHVDMVLSGHVHHYMRTKPINNQEVVSSPDRGTIYIISIGIPNHKIELQKREFVARGYSGEGLYQTFDINGNTLEYKTYNLEGNIIDELRIRK